MSRKILLPAQTGSNFFTDNTSSLRRAFFVEAVIKVVTILDLAKYILERQEQYSAWKLQKLCYYAQAWHYAWTERRLIAEDFQAWRNGPVCPMLFVLCKSKFIITADDIPGDSSKLNDDEKESVDVVLREYGNREPFELQAQVIFEEPWRLARGNLSEDADCETIITLESMGSYYGSL